MGHFLDFEVEFFDVFILQLDFLSHGVQFLDELTFGHVFDFFVMSESIVQSFSPFRGLGDLFIFQIRGKWQFL